MFDPGDGTSMSEFVDQRSLVTWSHTRHTDQQASCFSALFEAQAAQRPESIAVIYGQQHLTYQELNRRANQLAHYLRRLGVGPDVRVGLCVERSLDLAVGVLGILKAGGAYVPLDPTYPPARLQLMLQDAQTAVLVTQRRLVEMLSQGEAAGHARRICLDADASIIAQQPASDLASGVLPDHLAYVIYTSGSTGRPKGVLVTHRGIASLSQTQIRSFAVTPDARILQFASLSFDAAVWEMCMAWLSGAALVIAPTDALLPGPALIDTLRDYAITTVTLPPAVLTVLPDAALPALRTIIVAGEACPGAVVARWAVGRQLFNAYGPTETTICATVSDALSGSTAPPIGRALPNMCVYLLDARMQPVPDGAPGELCVGGIGLARGYHRRPDLTAERFVPDPFSQIGGARLYRTGDLARCLPDGNIEYLGRIDQQVKIRGFRVELGEIEAALRQHPAVRDAVVLAREDGNGDKRLVAYVVREQANKEPETRNSALTTRNADLRAYLANYLPDYMVPRAFIFLDALPLNANGKLDRSALPAPDSMRPDLDTAFVPPRTPTEALLAEIWAQVLGLDRVGVDDHFLLLGGHSLAATQVVARIRDRLAVDLPLPTLFTLPTVAELAVALDAARDVGSMQTEAIPLAPRDGLLPLTFAQEQVWLLQQLTPTNQSYSAQSTLRFRGALDVAVLRQSLNALVARHEILRTTFPEIGGHPVQRIGDPWHVALPLVDLSSSPEAEREAIVRQVIDAEFYAPFDVERLPLVRWTLVRLGPDEHLLIHVEHHFVHDGWSYAVFLRELFQLYRAGVTGQPAALPPLPLQFADYAVWQRQWLLSAEAERQRAYWRRILAGASPVLELPTDYPRPAMQRFQGTSARIELPPALCTAARATAQAEGVTLYMLLLTAFVTLMRRYSGQTDILVGSGVANRRTRETETLIGMIVNMVVLRANLPGNPTARELLRHVRDVALEAYAHQDLPFEQVVEAVAPQRTLRYNPIFQVAFNFHDSPLPELELPGLTVEVNEALSNGSAKFDLNIVAIPRAEQHLGQRERAADDGITLVWEYNTDLFSAATIERMVTHFQALIGQIAANPEQRIGNLPLLSEAERQQIVVEWNATATPYPHDRCIHQLFEEQAARTPDALAVVCGDQRLSYRELDQRANQLAHHLRVLGVGGRSQRETLVSVYLERSIELMVAILGVLKAGGAYVPLDPAYPTSRLAFMLAETQAPVLLTQHQLLDSLPTSQAQVICLDTAWEQIAGQPATALPSSTAAHNLAYVMYTSGSTGQPKGIGVMHQSVVRLVKQTNYVRLSPEDVFLQLAPMAFDAATFEIWGSLLNGAQLVLFPPMAPTLEQLGAAIEQHGITTLWLTAGLFHQMVDWQLAALGQVRQLLAGGDVLSVAHVNRALRELPRCTLINGYGPTENTTFTCCYVMAYGDQIVGSTPIGSPIANTRVYVLDHFMQPVPVGVHGELYIGGDGLARDYHRRPDLTAARFVPDPFSQIGGARLYRTGDLARYRSDGNIEFVGRIDGQVKLRGFRIELGEIETVLTQHPAVREAVVVVREESSEKRLVAYVVEQQNKEPETRNSALATRNADLRAYLANYLPDYMVPSAFVFLDALPLTANGKIDRRALPAPDFEHLKQTYVAPRTPDEETLAAIWAQVLKIERLGVHDNFFELGGHSLLATQVVARIRDAFKVEMPLHTLFESATVAGLAEQVARLQADKAGEADASGGARPDTAPLAPIGSQRREGVQLPLSFAQQRLWFLDRFEPGSPAYNICRSLIMHGSLDVAALHGSLKTIVERHAVLRTTFVEHAGPPVQVIAPTLELPLPLVDLH
ncbi:MAG TPA: amino acid adenylation domain-containing protein, partial [Herpetosiphonaceae bacterium]